MREKKSSCNLLMSGLGVFEKPLLELHAAREIGPFWKAAFRLLESVIPFHFMCLYLRPSSLTPSAIFRDGTPFQSQAEFDRCKKLNPMPAFFEAHPEVVVARLSNVLPEVELLQSEFYREHLALEDDRFLVCLCFRQKQTIHALIGLHRRKQHADYSALEMQLLEMMQPHLDSALKRVLDWHRENTERLLLGGLVSHLALPTVLLDWELSVLYCNESSKRMAAIWNLGPRCARSVSSQDCLKIPDEVFEVCRSLKTHWTPCRLPGEGTPPGPETTLICRRVQDLRVTVRLVDPPAHSLSMPSFMVVFEDRQRVSCVDTSAALSANSMLGRLSNCEQEVAQLVCAGKSNKEIAEALGKSVLTVKKQVQAIYKKLGVSSRARLVNLLIKNTASR